MNGVFRQLPRERVLFGAGRLTDLPAEADRLGGGPAMIVTGRSLMERTPVIARAGTLLGVRHAATFAGIGQHAPEAGIETATALAREKGIRLLISIGGGSPIDATKVVARRLADERGDYPPQIAIPTTLSAAEFSHIAGYTDAERGVKTGFRDPAVTPRVVILDPEITLHTPERLWLSSGIRALDHAIETTYSPELNPVSETLALRAIRDLFATLPRTRVAPEDADARLGAQLAAWMSFFAPLSVQMGLSHRIGRLIGATYGVPHGVTSCITLPHVIRVMARHAPGAIDRVAAAIPGDEAAADAVEGLIRQLNLPHRLRDTAVPRDALIAVARDAADERVSEAEMRALLERAW